MAIHAHRSSRSSPLTSTLQRRNCACRWSGSKLKSGQSRPLKPVHSTFGPKHPDGRVRQAPVCCPRQPSDRSEPGTANVNGQPAHSTSALLDKHIGLPATFRFPASDRTFSECRIYYEPSTLAMSRSKALSVLQKTYDDSYLSCSTAVYHESQVIARLITHYLIISPLFPLPSINNK